MNGHVKQETFREMLIRLRTERGLSQHRLSMVAMVSPSNLHRIESGKRGVPTAETVRAYARGLDLAKSEEDAFFEAAIRSRHDEAVAAVDALQAQLYAGTAVQQ